MFFKDVVAGYQRFRNRRLWERMWRKPGNHPGWMVDTPRPFVLHGFEAGWLVPGMKVLEIGCGRGNTAIWLAQRGLKVLGIDVSASAIRQAREAFPAQDGLTFKASDICGNFSSDTTYEVILDTGCLQHLSADLRVGYRENVLRASHTGSRLVVTMNTKKLSHAVRQAEVETLFTPTFKLVQIEEVQPGDKAQSHRNAVFHLIRDAASPK